MFIGYKFKDGTVAVIRRKKGEVWEFMTSRALTQKYGPCTVNNVNDWLKGYQCGPELSTARAARLAMDAIETPKS